MKSLMFHQGTACFMNMVTSVPKQNPLRKVGELDMSFGKTRQLTGEKEKSYYLKLPACV